MTALEMCLKDKSFHPQAYSTYNHQWLRDATIGSKNSNLELLNRVRHLSKSTQSLLHWEKNQRLLKLLPNCTLKSLISMTLRSSEHSREGAWNMEKGRPLTLPNHHATLPNLLQDQNQEHPLSVQTQQSRKRKRLKSLTYLGLSETRYLGLSSDLSCV